MPVQRYDGTREGHSSMTIQDLQQRRSRAYTAWCTGQMKRRTARRIIQRLNKRIEVLAAKKDMNREVDQDVHERSAV